MKKIFFLVMISICMPSSSFAEKIYILLDISGSMNGRGINSAKFSLEEILLHSDITSESSIGLIKGSGDNVVLQPRTNNESTIIKNIYLDGYGGNPAVSLDRLISGVLKKTSDCYKLVLITDGDDGARPYQYAEQIKQQCSTLNIVGVNLNYASSSVLRKLAHTGGGTFCNGDKVEGITECLYGAFRKYNYKKNLGYCASDSGIRGLNKPIFKEMGNSKDWSCYDFTGINFLEYPWDGFTESYWDLHKQTLAGSKIDLNLKYDASFNISAEDMSNVTFHVNNIGGNGLLRIGSSNFDGLKFIRSHVKSVSLININSGDYCHKNMDLSELATHDIKIDSDLDLCYPVLPETISNLTLHGNRLSNVYSSINIDTLVSYNSRIENSRGKHLNIRFLEGNLTLNNVNYNGANIGGHGQYKDDILKLKNSGFKQVNFTEIKDLHIDKSFLNNAKFTNVFNTKFTNDSVCNGCKHSGDDYTTIILDHSLLKNYQLETNSLEMNVKHGVNILSSQFKSYDMLIEGSSPRSVLNPNHSSIENTNFEGTFDISLDGIGHTDVKYNEPFYESKKINFMNTDCKNCTLSDIGGIVTLNNSYMSNFHLKRGSLKPNSYGDKIYFHADNTQFDNCRITSTYNMLIGSLNKCVLEGFGNIQDTSFNQSEISFVDYQGDINNEARVIIKDSDFTNCTINGAENLTEDGNFAIFNSTLKNSKLDKSMVVDNSNLENCNLTIQGDISVKSEIKNSILSSGNIIGTNFIDWHGSELNKMTLKGEFNRNDFTDVSFNYSTIMNATFLNSIFLYNKFIDTTIEDTFFSPVKRATFNNTKLEGTTFSSIIESRFSGVAATGEFKVDGPLYDIEFHYSDIKTLEGSFWNSMPFGDYVIEDTNISCHLARTIINSIHNGDDIFIGQFELPDGCLLHEHQNKIMSRIKTGEFK